MQNRTQDKIAVSPLNLPKGGGAIRGMGETLADVGPSGMASFTLPLPISGGRGYAPQLALSYSSGGGNGVFGMGWDLPLMCIRRRTNRGVPQYNDQDEFIGPDGEVLVPQRDDTGTIVTRDCVQYDDKPLQETYSVARYFPRVEGAFDLLECWRRADAEDSFWLVHGTDGQLHCLGKTALGRTASPLDGNPRIAEWWLEESLSPTGEHISYQYRAEDDAGVDVSGQEAVRGRGALSYPVRARYGNQDMARHLYAWDADTPEVNWLFTLVFDYGERSIDPAQAPPMDIRSGSEWLARADAFSGYHYGYETRCHRLCRQVLMYHHFPDELDEAATLVSRLILDYDENPVLTRLLGARQWACPDRFGTVVQSLPPLTFTYSAFDAAPSAAGWQNWEGLPGLNDGRPFQLVDLHGEGLPGVLSRLDDAWCYREPLRDGGQDAVGEDAVSYGDWQALPRIPAMQTGNARLMDSTGDGTLDWVVARPGLAGYFSLGTDRTWSNFTPFSALPAEFLHPQAQLADLIGAGLSDLALIGPKSVRLYVNQRDGFGPGHDVAQDSLIDLPVAGRDADTLVAFSDLLGSGQQHLTQIGHDNVWCWPNLGRGRFGGAVELGSLDLESADFNPQRLYLADIDGSGADDILYAQGERLLVYFNQCGNGFADPVSLPWPEGARFDHLCQLNIADIQAQGIASLILTIPYPEVKHWRYDFCAEKPYLLNGFNNNMGADCRLCYRSSAQFWLDEKAEDETAVTTLMFPLHVVAQVVQTDEVTGNTLSQHYRYRKGVYDGKEREFRGFGLIEEQDTGQGSSASGDDIAFSPPALSKTWFHTGREQDEKTLAGQPWSGDAAAYTLSDTRFTQWQSDADVALPASADAGMTEGRWWMFRALKGSMLRQEVYALDSDASQDIPYSVDCFRYQARLHQPSQYQSNPGQSSPRSAPVVVPSVLEQMTWRYERIANDPQCVQQVILERDAYGHPLHTVGIDYPRRPQGVSLYPDTLPPTALASSYDEQQQSLRLSESRQSYYNLDAPDAWQLGLPWQQRGNALIDTEPMPGKTWSFESLSAAASPLNRLTRIFAGQQVTFYRKDEAAPQTLPVLVYCLETAELDESALRAYDDAPGMTTDKLAEQLRQAGYKEANTVLNDDAQKAETVWVARHDYATHLDELFYLPGSHQKTALSGPMTYRYSDYGFLSGTVDALGNAAQVTKFDYRLLLPLGIQDHNQNLSEVFLDGFGRAVGTSLSGIENGAQTGFERLRYELASPMNVPYLLALSMDDTYTLVTAVDYAHDVFSWMGQLSQDSMPSDAAWPAMLANKWLALDPSAPEIAYITASGHRWSASGEGLPDLESDVIAQMKALIIAAARIPVHSAALLPDRYPHDTAQQKQISIHYNDGFGRALQTVAKDNSGPAYRREADGELAINEKGDLIQANAPQRWAVSGRVEYDNKGQTVRVYQPYFVNDWQYVADSAMRAGGYADTYFYDALGRVRRVETAKGYLRRAAWYPWFTVAEDENDTLLDSGPSNEVDNETRSAAGQASEQSTATTEQRL